MPQDENLYDRLGADAGVRKLVNLFYDYMDSLPEAKQIRSMHKLDLSDTREKLYEYFSGWFGGPQLFVEKYGHPRLRMRHHHVEIGLVDRDAWLSCLHHALQKMDLDEALRRDLLEKIEPMADHMRNMDEEIPLADC